MNNKLTLIAVVTLNAAAVVSIFGCRSTTGMEADSNRSAYNGTASGSSAGFSGFPGDTGASGYSAGSATRAPAVAQTAPAAVPVATHAASPADEPMGAPGTETVAPAPVIASESTKAKAVETAPAPATVDEPKAVGAGHTYVVKSNDSLWVIARREGVSIDELTAANGMKRNAVLKPGQKLVIPASSGKKSVAHNAGASSSAAKTETVAPSGDTYTVVSGDALSIVARKLHTTTAALRAANPQLKGDNIRVGQKLAIPGGAKAPAAAASKPGATAKPATGETAPAAVPARAPAAGSSSLGLPEIAPLGGVPASGAAPAATAPAPAPAGNIAPEAVEATPVSR